LIKYTISKEEPTLISSAKAKLHTYHIPGLGFIGPFKVAALGQFVEHHRDTLGGQRAPHLRVTVELINQ
jgi:hypothetical protein